MRRFGRLLGATALLALLLPPQTAQVAAMPDAQQGSVSGTIQYGDLVLDFSFSGGAIETTTEGAFDFTIEGTVKPGETISIAASAQSLPVDPDSVNLPQDASFAVWFDGEEMQQVTLAPGEGGSLAASLVVPADEWRVSGQAMISQAWVNPYGGGSRTLSMDVDLEVVAPETTTTTPVTPAPPPVDEDCEIPDDYWDATGDEIVRFGGLHGDVSVRPNCADDDAYVFAWLDMALHHDDRIKTLTRSGAILSFSDMSTFVMKEDTTIVLDIANEQRSKLGLIAGNVWVNLQKMVKGGSMEVEMGHAVLGTKGTTFVVDDTGTASIVKVFEGTVEVRPNAGGTIEVGPSQMVEVMAEGAGQVTGFDVEAELATWDDETQRITRAAMAAASDTPATSATSATSDDDGGSSWPVVALVVVLAGAVVVVVALLVRGRRHGPPHGIDEPGDGWWVASDGKRYPPETHPDYRPRVGLGSRR